MHGIDIPVIIRVISLFQKTSAIFIQSRINFTIDIDQRVEQLDLNLRLADQGTIGQANGESMYVDFIDDVIGDGEYDTLDPFYSL